MDKIKSISIICITIIVLSALLIPAFVKNKNIIEDEKIKKLESENDSLSIVNSILSKKDSLLIIQIDSISNIVSDDKGKIISLSHSKNEKIKIINGLDNHGLYMFFTNFPATGNIDSIR